MFNKLKSMMSGMSPDMLDENGNPVAAEAAAPDAEQSQMADKLLQQLQEAQDAGGTSPMEAPANDTIPNAAEPESPSFINQLEPEQQEQLMALIAAMQKPSV